MMPLRTISLLRALLLGMALLSGVGCQSGTPPAVSIAPSELVQRMKEPKPPVLLDVRTPEEYAAGHIDGALNIPHDQLEKRLAELPADRSAEIVVYCRSGKRAGTAEKILIEKGYTNVKDLAGHWLKWSERQK